MYPIHLLMVKESGLRMACTDQLLLLFVGWGNTVSVRYPFLLNMLIADPYECVRVTLWNTKAIHGLQIELGDYVKIENYELKTYVR